MEDHHNFLGQPTAEMVKAYVAPLLSQSTPQTHVTSKNTNGTQPTIVVHNAMLYNIWYGNHPSNTAMSSLTRSNNLIHFPSSTVQP